MKKTDKLTLNTKGQEWYLYVNGTKVGKVGVDFSRDTEKYYHLPKKTGCSGAIEVFDKYTNKGYGRKFVKLIEKEAKKRGMKNFAFTNIHNTRFFRSVGYQALPGAKRIMVKSLITGRMPAGIGYTRTRWVKGKPVATDRRIKGRKSKIIRTGRESYAERVIRETQAKRTTRAKKLDKKKTANISFTAPSIIPLKQLKKWSKHPERYDIWGVDTPI